MLPQLNSTMSERPRVCRNLASAFDAVSVGDAEPREQGENRENLFVEQLLNGDCERFKARWGYDPREDKPVEGSNWEYEVIHTSTSRRQEGTPGVENGVVVENVAANVEDPVDGVPVAEALVVNDQEANVEIQNVPAQ